MLQGAIVTSARARALRSTMSLPEVLLWQALRTRPGGLKFRRQHPAGPYVLDFYCHEARLIIEIDGEAHARADRPARDALRDVHFRALGFRILRFAATEIMRDAGGVADAIAAWAAASPPRAGED